MLDRLHYEISQVCPIDGVDSNGTISYKPEASESEIALAQLIYLTFDFSQEAHDLWLKSRTNQLALSSLMTRQDDIGVALRIVIRDVYTQINDIRVFIGLDRISEADILQRLNQRANQGWGF